MQNVDRQILLLLREDARLSPLQLASSLGIDEATAAARVRALEESGAIVKYTAVICDEETEENEVEALIEVKVTPSRGEGFDAIAREIAAHEEVKNLYLMSGGYDLAVIVHGASLKEISRFISEKISTYDSVLSTATHFILKKYKIEGAQTSSKSASERLSVQA